MQQRGYIHQAEYFHEVECTHTQKKIPAKNLALLFDSVFSFQKTTQAEAENIIGDLNIRKSCQISDILTKIIKVNFNIFVHFDFCIDKGNFPNELQHADIFPVNAKKRKCEKENYSPGSMLSKLSKIYEKLMYNQLSEYFDTILFQSQCCFRKGFSAQHCLLVIKYAIDRGNEFGALLTDLSKAFNCIKYPFLIAEIYSYEVSPLTTNMIFSYI